MRIKRHNFCGTSTTKLVPQNIKEGKGQPSDTQLTIDRAKLGAQGGLTFKSVFSRSNCCTFTFLEIMSLSVTLSHMVFSDNAVTPTQGVRIPRRPQIITQGKTSSCWDSAEEITC